MGPCLIPSWDNKVHPACAQRTRPTRADDGRSHLVHWTPAPRKLQKVAGQPKGSGERVAALSRALYRNRYLRERTVSRHSRRSLQPQIIRPPHVRRNEQTQSVCRADHRTFWIVSIL